jgi:hypothetical protein
LTWHVEASWPAAFEQGCFGLAEEEAFDQQWRRRSPLAETPGRRRPRPAQPAGQSSSGSDQIGPDRGNCLPDDLREASACFGLGASGPGNLLRVVRAWRLCAPIASSSWPVSGLGGCAARGRHWWCHGPGRGGRRNRRSGCGVGASTRDGAGYSPTSQPTRRIPGRSCRQSGGWQRCLRHPASRVGAPTRQAQ